MDLAGRVFDVVVSEQNIDPAVRPVIPQVRDPLLVNYGRRTLRMAALCHDIGHLPFSHAAEAQGILPDDWDHERLSVELIQSDRMASLWKERPPINAEDVAILAVGPETLRGRVVSSWDAVLAEIITGSAFGVDRMDYLLRDSHHAGVAYGRFDHYRLIDTLRILPQPGPLDDGSLEPQLGVEEGGLRSAEALLLARYFMFTQVYFHRVRRVFDLHLKDFLRSFAQVRMSGGRFPIDPEEHLRWTDEEVTAAMLSAARDPDEPGHDAARRIVFRDPFKLLWERSPRDIQQNDDAGLLIYQSAQAEFGVDAVRRDVRQPSAPVIDFPVRRRDGSIESAHSLSDVIPQLPTPAFDFIFIRPDLAEKAIRWLADHRNRILRQLPSDEV